MHWSEEDMISALETVRSGTMSINQAAIHFHLPYSSLYGRINRSVTIYYAYRGGAMRTIFTLLTFTMSINQVTILLPPYMVGSRFFLVRGV